MKRIALFGLALTALALLVPGQAYAQATRTWVSGVGDDANPCSRTAPCKTFAGAISKTAPGGEIDVLDPGGFGALTITKSITIDGSGGSVAGVLVAGTNGFVVAAGNSDVVILRNLDFNGLLGGGNANAGINGIRFISGSQLVVENCKIFGFNTWGIDYENGSPTSQLYVLNTTLSNNGVGTTGGGILVQSPSNAATAAAAIDGVKVTDGAVGIKVSGDSSSTTTFVTIENSRSLGSPHSGVVAETGAGAGNGPVTLMLNRVVSSNNHVGVQANGTGALALLGDSTVSGNTTGVLAQNNGVVQSYKNNQINGNGTDGTPLTAVPNGPLN